MHKKILSALFIFSALLFLSCEDEVDLNTDWNENTIVYGIIDMQQDTQYIKILKSFIGDDNFNEMAKISDSSYYDKKLNVWIEWINAGITERQILDTIHLPDLEEGVFNNSNNHAYYFLTPQGEYDENTRCKLYIEHPETGKTSSSETNIITPFTIKKPSSFRSELALYTGKIFKDIPFEWYVPKSTVIHNVTIRFHYIEFNNNGSDTVNKHLDWSIGTKRTTDPENREYLYASANSESLYNLIQKAIPEDTKLNRLPGTKNEPQKHLEILIQASGEHLSNYIDITTPSSSIVQERPDYTNITNGFGIFSSAYTASKSLKFDAVSYDFLSNGDETKQLNFIAIPFNRE